MSAVSGTDNLAREIATILNRYSAENQSGTPDFILAEYLASCLDNFDRAIQRRAKWRGESTHHPDLIALRDSETPA